MIGTKMRHWHSKVFRRFSTKAMIQMGRSMVVLFACCAALVIVFLVHSRSRKVDEVSLPNNDSTKKLVFKGTAIFDGETEDGVRFVDYHYKSSDCIAISHKTIFFESPPRAREEIEREAKKASSIIERAPVVNEQGQQIGERVVLQFETSEQYKAHAEAIWNRNSDFHSIAASSLDRVLEFEKALASQTGRISSRIDSVQNVDFTALETRDGSTEEGFVYSQKEFRSSDCEIVIARTEYFPSPVRAQEEMLKKLKASTNIMERGPKLDAAGQQVGQRIVAMFKAEIPAEYIEDTVLMWTVNSELHSLRGLYTYVLELEKRNY